MTVCIKPADLTGHLQSNIITQVYVYILTTIEGIFQLPCMHFVRSHLQSQDSSKCDHTNKQTKTSHNIGTEDNVNARPQI